MISEKNTNKIWEGKIWDDMGRLGKIWEVGKTWEAMGRHGKI